jgi:hypothetical protein
MTSKAQLKRDQKAEAINTLLALIKPGMTIYTAHRDKSGNQHSVHIITSSENSEHQPYLRDITHLVALAIGSRRTKDGYYIQSGGYGYSKSFHIVYSLGNALWPNGTPVVHGTRNGEPDRCGGYALKQSSV